MDDMARMNAEFQRKYFKNFPKAMHQLYGPILLNRQPTSGEIPDAENKYALSGVPGCIGCFDCMQLGSKNCSTALKRQYHNPKAGKLATISCEALVETNLYYWHWFCGRAGTNNEIAVLDNSPLFHDILGDDRRMTHPEGFLYERKA